MHSNSSTTKREYPAYIVEDFKDPDLALVATDYAPFKPFFLSNRAIEDKEAVTFQVYGGTLKDLTIRNINDSFWLFASHGAWTGVAHSGYVANKRGEFVGLLSQVPQFHPYGATKTLNNIQGRELRSLGKVVEASRIRNLMTALSVPIEDKNLNLSPEVARVDLEIGTPRRNGEKLVKVDQQLLCAQIASPRKQRLTILIQVCHSH